MTFMTAFLLGTGCWYVSGSGGEKSKTGDEQNGKEKSFYNASGVKIIRGAPALPMPKKKWTVMVYMDGDNNLSGFTSDDIREMMSSGSDDGFNIVVLWDNEPDQESGSKKNRHGYYYITKDGAVLLEDTGEVNMGGPMTAMNFMDYCLKNFKSEKYAWIYWNHGGAVDRAAATRGVCWDDTNDGDHLTELEQTEIMDHFMKKAGKKLDLVGFDACLMATAEIVCQYAGRALYLVASEQTVPGEGWDYSFLGMIKSKPAVSASSLAKGIVSYYKKFYASESDATISAVQLKHASGLRTALDEFSKAALSSGIPGKTFKDLSKGMPVFGYYEDGGKKYYFTKDLYFYMERVGASKDTPAAAKNAAAEAMRILKDKKFMVSEWHGSEWKNRAFGLSITLKSSTPVYKKLVLCTSTKWDEFLDWAGFPTADTVF
jgi:hypothetical protein